MIKSNEDASDNLKSNREIVLVAARKDGSSIKYAFLGRLMIFVNYLSKSDEIRNFRICESGNK
jgi:hypothetical protein